MNHRASKRIHARQIDLSRLQEARQQLAVSQPRSQVQRRLSLSICKPRMSATVEESRRRIHQTMLTRVVQHSASSFITRVQRGPVAARPKVSVEQSTQATPSKPTDLRIHLCTI